MAKFYFHLHDGIDELLDPDGTECDDLEAAKTKALWIARDLIAADATKGLIDLCCRLDVEDASRDVAYSLPFEEAVTIKRGTA